MTSTYSSPSNSDPQVFHAMANKRIMTRWITKWPCTAYVTKRLPLLEPSLASRLRHRLCATAAIGMHATDMNAFSVLPLKAAFTRDEYDRVRTACESEPTVGDAVFVPGQDSLCTVWDNAKETLMNVVHGDFSAGWAAPTTHGMQDADGQWSAKMARVETHGMMVVPEHETAFYGNKSRFRPNWYTLLAVGNSNNIAIFGHHVKEGSDFVLYGGIHNWDEGDAQEIKQHSRMFPDKMQKHESLQEMCENDHPHAVSLLAFHPEIKTLMSAIRAELPHPDLVLVDMHILFFGKKRFEMHQDRHADYIGWNLLWTVTALLSDTDSSMRIAGVADELQYKSDLKI